MEGTDKLCYPAAPEGAYSGRNGMEDPRSIELRSVNGAAGMNGVNKVDPEDVKIKTGKKKKESEPVTGVFEVVNQLFFYIDCTKNGTFLKLFFYV